MRMIEQEKGVKKEEKENREFDKLRLLKSKTQS